MVDDARGSTSDDIAVRLSEGVRVWVYGAIDAHRGARASAVAHIVNDARGGAADDPAIGLGEGVRICIGGRLGRQRCVSAWVGPDSEGWVTSATSAAGADGVIRSTVRILGLYTKRAAGSDTCFGSGAGFRGGDGRHLTTVEGSEDGSQVLIDR